MQYLVSGPDQIPNEKLTSSSWEWDAGDNGDHSPSQARLNMTRVTYRNGPVTGYNAGVWAVAAGMLDIAQWIQVKT